MTESTGERAGSPAERRFREEMEALRKTDGRVAEQAAYEAFSTIAGWIRTTGHGNFQGNCVNHVVGKKVKFESIVEVARRKER